MSKSTEVFVGRVVGSDFELVRLLATGGMGAVYEATQRSTGKARALKMMHTWLLRDDRMRERFIDEARIAGSIDSDHVVEVVSAGIDEELGAPWVAMELLRGVTLTEHLEQVHRLRAPECLEVLTQLCDGLALAHERGLVHRDLKPDNIFVAAARRRGVPFTIELLDFGIAKWIHEASSGVRSSLARGGPRDNSQAMGTPSWMAPEQLSPGATIGPETDVWALGLLAFWMLTGKEYWLSSNNEHGSVSALLLELVTQELAPAAERAAELSAPALLPPGFDTWFARCVHRVPSERFQDAASCLDAFADLLERQSVQSAPELDLAALLRASSSEDLRAAASTIGGRADDDGAFWVAQAAAAEADPITTPELSRWLRRRTRPRPTARPLGPDGVARLFAGDPALSALTHVCELMAEPLMLAVRGRRASSSPGEARPRPVPESVHDAVRHAALVLGVRDAISVVSIGGDAMCFRVQGLEPIALGASSALRTEDSPLVLRASAALAIARTFMGLGLVGALSSPADLDDALKAAQALARGTISPSKHYRPLVSRLGARRAELSDALDAARGIASEAWWSAAELTLARAALLACADVPTVLSALEALAPATPLDEVRQALARFVLSPTFADLWHRPSTRG